MTTPSQSKLAFLEELRRIAQWGLGYTTDPYDIERYERLLELASIEYGAIADVEPSVLGARFAAEIGANVTPKVGLDAAIFDDDGKLLLIRRSDDGLMALPGGWAELGESPEEGIAREVLEETGLEVEIGALIGHYCRMPGEYGQPHTSYHMMFHGAVTGGVLQTTEEATEIGYYDPGPIRDWHRDMAAATEMAVNWWATNQTWVGVDGCPGGWCVCALKGDRAEFMVYEHFSEVIERWSRTARIFVDIPIGLTGNGSERDCDALARKMMGARASTVFTAPARRTLSAKTHVRACEINQLETGSKISIQAFGILPKIREVDVALQRNRDVRDQIIEVHPELVLRALNGGVPLPSKKREVSGRNERLALLEKYWSGAQDAFAGARHLVKRDVVAADDIVDAMAIAVGFYASRGMGCDVGTAGTVDETGLPMRMCVPRI